MVLDYMRPSFKFDLKQLKKIKFGIILFISFICVFNGLYFYFEISNLAQDHEADQISIPKAQPDLISPTGVRAPMNNSPPYFIKPLHDLELNEDFGSHTLNLSEYAFDNEDPAAALRYFTTNENKSLINITNDNATDQKLIINSIADAFGETLFKVWVSDQTGQSVFREMTIKIRPLNDLPKILDSELPILKVNFETPYSINLQPYIFDPDTPVSEITLSVHPSDREYASVQNYNLNLNFKTINEFNKNHITLKLSENANPNYFSQVNIKINLSDNHPPELLRAIPEITLYLDESLSKILDLDYYFEDLDHDNELLEFEYYQASKINVKINQDNTIDLSSDGTWEGIEQILIRCIDPFGAFKEQIVSVRVTSKTGFFWISAFPDLNVHYDVEYNFELRPYFCLNDTSTNIKYEINEFVENRWVNSEELSNIRFEYANICPNLKINYSKDYLNSTIPVFFSISDGISSKFQEFLIKITDNYPPIIKKPISDCVFDEDTICYSELDLYEYFFDIENGTLGFSNITENVILDIKQNGVVDITSKPDWHGSELVTIRANDVDRAIVETSFYVTVSSINDQPKILPIPLINITEGDKESFEFIKYVSDVDHNVSELTIEVIGDDRDYITIAGSFLILHYPTKITGERTFTLRVSDGELSDSQIIKVTITPQERKGETDEFQITTIMFLGSVIILIIMILSLLIMSIVYIRRLRSFQFNEIYLIYKDGLLIAHATKNKKISHDSDIIGSMFTAIQDFIHESFSDSKNIAESSELKRLDFGDFQIVIDRGEHIYIAAVYSGFAIRKMLLKINKLRKEIERNYADVLPNWNGGMEQLKGTQRMILDLLHSTGPGKNRATRATPKKRPKSGSDKIKHRDVVGELDDVNDDALEPKNDKAGSNKK